MAERKIRVIKTQLLKHFSESEKSKKGEGAKEMSGKEQLRKNGEGN